LAQNIIVVVQKFFLPVQPWNLSTDF